MIMRDKQVRHWENDFFTGEDQRAVCYSPQGAGRGRRPHVGVGGQKDGRGGPYFRYSFSPAARGATTDFSPTANLPDRRQLHATEVAFWQECADRDSSIGPGAGPPSADNRYAGFWLIWQKDVQAKK